MHLTNELKLRARIIPPRTSGLFLALCSATSLSLSAAAAQSSDLAPTTPIVLDIPAQPLEAALDAYGAKSRMHVLYESNLTSGRRSVAVDGRFTPAEALRLLLAGTDLTARFTGARSFTLAPAPHEASRAGTSVVAVASPVPPRWHVLDFPHFLGGVQAGITERLCQDDGTRPGAYRITLRFWIDSSGAIQSPMLVESSGDKILDAAITADLSHLVFSEAPPTDMPQPVTMVIEPHPVPADRICHD
jgi:hypothetical protein